MRYLIMLLINSLLIASLLVGCSPKSVMDQKREEAEKLLKNEVAIFQTENKEFPIVMAHKVVMMKGYWNFTGFHSVVYF